MPIPLYEAQTQTTRSSTNYTKVPNNVFDDLLMKMNPYQAKIAMWILRQTYGWKREWTPAIGYRGLGEAVSMDKMSIMKHIQSGIKEGFFERIEAGGVYQYRLRLSEVTPCEPSERKHLREENTSAHNRPETKKNTHQPYEKIIQNRMKTSYKTVLRNHTVFLGPKEKKERNKRTTADNKRPFQKNVSSSSYFSHLEQKSESESSVCSPEMGAKRKILASLPFKQDQIETLIRNFDFKTLKQALDWEKTARYDDLGAAFYSACKNLWEPKRNPEERFQGDKDWSQQKLGKMDGKVIRRYRVDILNKSVELVPAAGGNCQPIVLNYGEKGFRKKAEISSGNPVEKNESLFWISNYA